MESVSVASKGVGDSCCKILSENTLARRKEEDFAANRPAARSCSSVSPVTTFATDNRFPYRAPRHEKKERKRLWERNGEKTICRERSRKSVHGSPCME